MNWHSNDCDVFKDPYGSPTAETCTCGASERKKVVRLPVNYGTKEHPCYVPPPSNPEGGK